ncbi:MAG: prolipoprotein diacylglyceryl transferase [Saprospiraceae bacterium]|nr:prolipoprotein diacylglyceryl transferase [Saprospiraceae bacterium]
MDIPFEPNVFGLTINIHLILEYLAFFVAFRYYLKMRRSVPDQISDKNRLSIILGAIIGAFVGSRLVGYFENPLFNWNSEYLIHVLNSKSIMGGLFGGLIGVELAKKIIGEKKSSGDLFTYPIILGIIIGRIGCFLYGVKEFTYGKATTAFTGMDLGDGLNRHPIALYEIVYLLALFLILPRLRSFTEKENGLLFKIFMIAYFGFRFFIEFLKPNVFFVIGLSSIQWLCILCWVYYLPTIQKLIKNAY